MYDLLAWLAGGAIGIAYVLGILSYKRKLKKTIEEHISKEMAEKIIKLMKEG